MSVRLQTWFPRDIQIARNGQAWLQRSLHADGLGYAVHGNRLLHVDDFAAARARLDAQCDARWAELLEGLLPEVFPARVDTREPHRQYKGLRLQHPGKADAAHRKAKIPKAPIARPHLFIVAGHRDRTGANTTETSRPGARRHGMDSPAASPRRPNPAGMPAFPIAWNRRGVR